MNIFRLTLWQQSFQQHTKKEGKFLLNIFIKNYIFIDFQRKKEQRNRF